MIASLLLATAEQASRYSLPKAEILLSRGLQIFFSTVFSVIIIWVVMKIWKGEWWAGDDDNKKS